MLELVRDVRLRENCLNKSAALGDTLPSLYGKSAPFSPKAFHSQGQKMASVCLIRLIIGQKVKERSEWGRLLQKIFFWTTFNRFVGQTWLGRYLNQTNVQLCSSQVDKGKCDRFSEKFVCAKKFCVKIFLGENLLGEHFLSEHFFLGEIFRVKIFLSGNFG